MRKIIGFILIITLSILCHSFARGDQKDEVPDVINKFYDSVQAGNTDSLLETMVPDMAEKVKQNPSKAGEMGDVFTITRQVAQGMAGLEFKDRKIKVLDKTEKTAKVATKIYVTIINKKNNEASELQSSDIFLLRRIQDRWLIENIAEETK